MLHGAHCFEHLQGEIRAAGAVFVQRGDGFFCRLKTVFKPYRITSVWLGEFFCRRLLF